jgi:hypothetical protein
VRRVVPQTGQRDRARTAQARAPGGVAGRDVERARGATGAPGVTGALDPATVARLQRAAGNGAVAGALRPVQRELDLMAIVSDLLRGLASLVPLGASAIGVVLDVARGVKPSEAVVRQLLELGVSEEDATDLLLFARHPQLMGRKLGPGDEKLMAEWKSIRSTVVRPLLREIEKARDDERGRPAKEPKPGTGPVPEDDVDPGEAPTPVAPTTGEADFILDTDRSFLTQIPGGKQYLDFDWHPLDFPGKKVRLKDTSPEYLDKQRSDPRIVVFEEKGAWYIKGANQDRATRMFALLARHVPERRANTGSAAVLTEKQFAAHEAAYDRYIQDQLEPMTSQPKLRLNRHARAAFETMRAAAEKDGVRLRASNSFRPRTTARRSAAKAGNKAAVASFSSHTLGLAVDLQLHVAATKGQWTETSTRMDNLVGMYRSPGYKWMAQHAAGHGWYPYRAEPWHWEYNPEGFRETFWADAEERIRPG